MRPLSILSLTALLVGATGCDGSFVVDPDDPRLDLTVAAREYSGKPLIYLNGTRISIEELHRIDRDRIASIEVLKGQTALALYGAEARDGVITVSLKP